MANNNSFLLLAIVLMAAAAPPAYSATVSVNVTTISVSGTLPTILPGGGIIPTVLQLIGVNVSLICNGSLIGQTTTGLLSLGNFNIITANLSAIDPLFIGVNGSIPCNVTARVRGVGSIIPSTGQIISAPVTVTSIIFGALNGVISAVTGVFSLVG
ncbi:OLC1v1009118C1 [Oldenlandia corymbosa var. corymbosa]|uniref:OLC1v1009118C1 n=1 Tax=Oldenlandia corymbosa var. corymbosa TaxID=529605 RepID=A0AAV1DQL5_OLDCO|nr:OLC1v1009118C1 [Oldenlandia corymbosa var. corymbosa]